MLNHRVIPALLLKNGGLVKTHKFKDPKYVGDPINAIRIFNDKEVDELMVLDIVASKEGKEPDYRMIELFAGECFMPLCYGGGIKTMEQADRIFNMGVEKISIQTAAIEDLGLIREVADKYGSQAVVISVDIKRTLFGGTKLYRAATSDTDKENWKPFLTRAGDAGAGEVLINAVDKDGTLSGPDLELIREANSELDIPLIALGGVSSLEDIRLAVEAGASAVAAGAFFVFHGPHRAVLITYPKYEELENLFMNGVNE
jgi:cyclase